MMNILKSFKDLFKNAEFVKYFFNTGWMMAERILRTIVSMFVGIFFVRYLGPEDYGILSYAQSFVTLFTPLLSLGIDSILVRELVKYPEKRDELLGTAFILKSIGSFTFLIVIIISILIMDNDFTTNAIMIVVALGFSFRVFDVIYAYFQSIVRNKFTAISSTIALSVSNILLIIMMIIGAGLIPIAIVVASETFVLSIGYLYFYKYNKLNFRKWRFKRDKAVEILKDSWPLVMSGFAVTIALRIDQVMIQYMMNSKHVGYYAAGVRLAEAFTFIPMLIGQSIFPKLVSMNYESNRKKLVTIFRYIFYLLITLAIFVFIFSKELVITLFGYEYISSYSISDIIIFTIPITYLGILTNILLLKDNLQKIIFIKQAFLSFFNIVFNILMIPKFGLVGAAYATLFADILINIFFDLINKKSKWLFYIKIESILFIKVKI